MSQPGASGYCPMHIVHISSVHNACDPRIRDKQLRSITDCGWQATLITGDLQARQENGLQTVTVSPGNTRRALRMILTAPKAILKAFREDADVYHIHDPELLPWALLLRLKGKPVVYDIHEDYSAALIHKHYLPAALLPVAAALMRQTERLLGAFCYKIIAENYYQRHFPDALPILNYPLQERLADCNAFTAGSKHLLYTGNLTTARGALNMARLLKARPDFTLCAAGYCPLDLDRAVRLEAGSAADRLHLLGAGKYLPFAEITEIYQAGGWLAGLALFPDSAHYREKELSKFFEYMAAGLPVVASDFPAWKNLIQDQGLGLCVDAEDPESVAQALDWLYGHPEQARAMGQKGQKLVAEKYNWQSQGRRLLEFYQQIVR